MTKVAENFHESEQWCCREQPNHRTREFLFGDISEMNSAICFRQPLRLADTDKSARGARRLSGKPVYVEAW